MTGLCIWGQAINSMRPSTHITSAVQATSHYLNQCWNSVNWTLRNKLQWNFNRNSYILILENVFENVVCKMAFISSRSQCVNSCNSTDADFSLVLYDVMIWKPFHWPTGHRWFPSHPAMRSFDVYFVICLKNFSTKKKNLDLIGSCGVTLPWAPKCFL